MPENTELGSSVHQVIAKDDDGDNIIYELTGEDDSKEVFHVNPFTGLILLKKSFTKTNEMEYKVKIFVRSKTI